jgi:hypothetical protein
MDIADWLEAITQKCHLVVAPDQVVRIAPDLCVDAPTLWDLGEDDTERSERYRYPVACTAVLAPPVAEVVSVALAGALDDKQRESFAQYSTADWAGDPLTATMARLLLEAALVSPEATGLPLLELARISAGLLSNAPVPGSARGSSAAEIERNLPRLDDHDAMRRGEILAQVAWSLSARISAAWGLAAQLSPSLRPTRFYQALLRSKLSLTLRADGTIPDLGLLLGALGLPGDPAQLTKLVQLCEAGLTALLARLGEGKGSPADRQFSASILTRAGISGSDDRRAFALAHDPDVCTAYLLRLSDRHSVKDLTKLGIDKSQAKQLLKPELAQAIAATLHDLLSALQLWDLLAGVIALVDRSTDIHVGSWSKSMSASLLVPRGDLGDTKAFVVAARLGDVQGKCFHEARTSDDAIVPLALESRFAALREQLRGQGAAVYSVGSHLMCVLSSATSALAAAQLITETATPPYALEFGALRESGSIPRGPAVGVGMAYGSVHGGFDGRTQSLRGPAIQQALGLTGMDAPHGTLGDPLGVRSVALGAAGLMSSGIVANPAFVEQLTDESSRQGRRFQLPDAGQPVAGVRKPFAAYPITGVREGNDRSVTVLLCLDGDDKDSPVEIIRMDVDAFQEFHTHEQGLAPGSCRGLSAGGVGMVPPPAPATPGTQPPGTQPPSTQPPSTPPAMASDPFSSEPGSLGPQGGSDFDFEVDDDDGGDEYEFDIESEAEPFAPPPSSHEVLEEDAFALDDLEVDDFEEGVLVLDDAPELGEEQHPLDDLDDDQFELAADDSDTSPFAFESDNAFSSGSEDGAASSDDDIFSFDDVGDDDDDPFGSATASNPAAISLSGESSLDAWDTPSPEEPVADPSEAGEQTDEEAPLGYLPPAEIVQEPSEELPEEDEPVPLGYLPPAPDQGGGHAAELHEVSLPTKPARTANPTLMPEEPAPARSPSPASDAPPAPPSMPASLLALLGEDDPSVPAVSSEPGTSGAFQFIASEESEPEVLQTVPEPEPEVLQTVPEPEPMLDLQEPEGDDPWGSGAAEPDEPAAELHADLDEAAPAGAEPSSDSLDVFDMDDEGDSEPVVFDLEPEPTPTTAQDDLSAAAIDDDDLPSDPLMEGDAEDFEALFSDDDDDNDGDAFDLNADEVEAAASDPAPAPTAPTEPESLDIASDPEADSDPFDMASDPEADSDPFDMDDAFEPDSSSATGQVSAEAADAGSEPDPSGLDVEDEPSADVEPAAPAGKGADGAKKVRSGRKSRTLPDFSFMFTGYQIYITEKNSVLFGHRHGAHLLDVHEYPCGDNIPEAYARFLADKVSERFVPRSDLSRPTPKHLEGNPLDISLLQQAFSNLSEEGT